MQGFQNGPFLFILGGVVGAKRVGSGNTSRSGLPIGLFANAPRFHSGGFVGLRPGEVPIVAKEGEEVITENDPRHTLNGGGQGGSPSPTPANVKNLNFFDAAEMIDHALRTSAGEQIFLNWVTNNPAAVRSALES